jgi:dihydrofolate reductase
MRKIKLYIAASLNGKIARTDGSVDWLESIPNPDKIDYGYAEFLSSVDTTIQGYKTYAQLMSWGIEFPYPDKKNYVITRKKNLVNTKDVEFVSQDHVEFFRKLKIQDGKDIWLIGGGRINTMFLNENLMDEIRIFIMPIIIPDGIGIFEMIPEERLLKLSETKTYSTGVIEFKYQIEGNELNLRENRTYPFRVLL